MYFFGGIAFFAALIVYGATFESLGEPIAIVLGIATWIGIVAVARKIVGADRARTQRKKMEKQVAKAAMQREQEPAAVSHNAAVEQADDLPDWASQLTPNRLEWLKVKLADGDAQGMPRSQVERALMIYAVEKGWIR